MKSHIVGGWVRDSVLGVEAKDKDYVVFGVSPEEIESQGFKRINGKSHALFSHPVTNDEYSMPKGIDLKSDLMKRDFTMNAIAYDVETSSYIDPCNGILDIVNQVVRHVYIEAFVDDPIRAIRALRFCANYGFRLHDDTAVLVKETLAKAVRLCPDRLYKEYTKVYPEKRYMFFKHLMHHKGAYLYGISDVMDTYIDNCSLERLGMLNESNDIKQRLSLPVDVLNGINSHQTYTNALRNLESPNSLKYLEIAMTTNGAYSRNPQKVLELHASVKTLRIGWLIERSLMVHNASLGYIEYYKTIDFSQVNDPKQTVQQLKKMIHSMCSCLLR